MKCPPLSSHLIAAICCLTVAQAGDQRHYPNTEIQINNHRYGEENGSVGTFDSNGKSICGHTGHVSEVTWTLQKTTLSGDIYTVTRKYPSDSPSAKTETLEFTYAGGTMLLWEDGAQRISLRPKFKKVAFGPLRFGSPLADAVQAVQDITNSAEGHPLTAENVRTYLVGSEGPVQSGSRYEDQQYFPGFVKDGRLKTVYVQSVGRILAEEAEIRKAWTALRDIAEEKFGKPSTLADLPPVATLSSDKSPTVTDVWHQDGMRAELAIRAIRSADQSISIGSILSVTDQTVD